MTKLILVSIILLDLLSIAPHKLVQKAQSQLSINFSEQKIISVPSFSPLAYKRTSEIPTAAVKAFLISDLDTGQILGGDNIDQPLQIASLTKLMVAKLMLDNVSMDSTVQPKNLSLVREGDAQIYLNGNESISYRNLFTCILVASGSDCAIAIANNVYPGGYPEFIEKMNQEASSMGLKNSRFDNPVGWDSNNNYSTARDLQILTGWLLKNDLFRETISLRSAVIKTDRKDYFLKNTNTLLDHPDFSGVKTGTTDMAGECLISQYSLREKNFLSIILGSSDRFVETESLLNSINLLYNW